MAAANMPSHMEAKSTLPQVEPGDFFQVGNEDLQGLRVYLRYNLFRALDDFALKNTSQDQAGLLLGVRSKDMLWSRVEEAVEVKPQDGVFPESVWREARSLAAKRYPNLEVVGWFHSHPGSGLGISQAEVEVHTKFFNEPWQVIYVMDPVLRERGFHAWRSGKLSYLNGFRIYGKQEKAAQNMEREPVRTDEHLRERYLERSVEKLQKMVRNPSVRTIDYVIIGLLVFTIALVLLKPTPTAKVDQDELLQGQQQIAQSVNDLNVRVQKVEEHLNAVGMLDAELKLPSAPEPSEITPTPVSSPLPEEVKTEAEASPSPSLEAKEGTQGTTAPQAITPMVASQDDDTGIKTGAKVQLHTVNQGDTLSSITEKYYQTSDPSVSDSLGKYNKLKPPHYDIFPGETLKVPDRGMLDS